MFVADPSRAPFAEGWYVVSWSHELQAAGVKPLRYFGREFVLYRSSEGQPALLDAHCPHLGAHLGHGGRVDADGIICPFHAWRFSSSGRCTSVPYASRIPAKARLRAYPVSEHSGMILAYFGPEGQPPSYEVPRIDELEGDAFSELECSQIEIATQPREVIENVADVAHFLPVHGTRIDEFEMIVDGPRATQRAKGLGGSLDGRTLAVDSVATYYGPAVQVTRLGWAYNLVLINAHVPIDQDRLLLRFGVAIEEGEGIRHSREVILAHMAAARDGYFQDVAIWENKRYRERPLLADGDGPIGEIRRWYQSFF